MSIKNKKTIERKKFLLRHRDSVIARLKNDGINLQDRQASIKHLNKCCGSSLCILVYKELINP